MFHDGILNNIIYGNARLHQEKFLFKRLDMDYHFTMCKHTRKGFQSRYHMSVNAYSNLVNILHNDIAPNEIKLRNPTSNNDPVTAKMVTCIGLQFMGGEKVKSLADIYRISARHARNG